MEFDCVAEFVKFVEKKIGRKLNQAERGNILLWHCAHRMSFDEIMEKVVKWEEKRK